MNWFSLKSKSKQKIKSFYYKIPDEVFHCGLKFINENIDEIYIFQNDENKL